MRLSLGMAALLLSSVINATPTSYTSADICLQSIGIWQGQFHLKNKADCDAYHGCTHGVKVIVNHLAKTAYLIDIQPEVGVGGTYPVKCENGNILTPLPHSFVKYACDTNGGCTVNYEDDRLTCDLKK